MYDDNWCANLVVELCRNNNNNNNILDSPQWEIKAVVRLHNKEHISIILSHEPQAHTLKHTPTFSQSAYTNSKPKNKNHSVHTSAILP